MKNKMHTGLNKNKMKALLSKALAEDKAFNDITTHALVSPNAKVSSKIVFKEDGVLCGIDFARQAFLIMDKRVNFRKLKHDGQFVEKNAVVAEVSGSARSILSAERTALNFLGHLSGIATLTAMFVKALKTSGARSAARITDTRKTLPLLREIEKYAVRTGAGMPHRMNLAQQFLVKDNHLDILEKKEKIKPVIEFAMTRIKSKNKALKMVEIEVRNLKEFKCALKLKPDIIMLDNMSMRSIKEALRWRKKINPRVKIEVSGRMTLAKVRRLSALNIDYISIGMLTHSAKSIDVSLEI